MAESILDYTDITKNHWETIQQWRIDEGKNFARSRSKATSRMAAGGMKPGSQLWEANLAGIDAANAKERESQKSSATMGILDRWTKEMKTFYVQATKDKALPITKGRDTVEYVPTSQKKQMKESGQVNPYVESGLSEKDFGKLTTEQFMELQFGYTDAYSVASDLGGERAQATIEEDDRRSAVMSQQVQASPWWA